MMETIICKICRQEKELVYYRSYKKKDNTYRYAKQCKDCGREAQKIRSKKYYENNKEQFLEDVKKYREDPINKEKLRVARIKWLEDNKEKMAKQYKEYAIENADKIAEYQKEYKEENDEHIKGQKHDYYVNNKETCRKRSNEWDKNKRKTDTSYKLRRNVSRSVLAALKANNSSKNGHSFLQAISYSMEELKEHLEKQFEPWMTWKNWGKFDPTIWDDNDQATWTWQIDHIIPHSTFNYTSMEDQAFKDCWALSNLRPYSAKQNFLDGSTKIRHTK